MFPVQKFYVCIWNDAECKLHRAHDEDRVQTLKGQKRRTKRRQKQPDVGFPFFMSGSISGALTGAIIAQFQRSFVNRWRKGSVLWAVIWTPEPPTWPQSALLPGRPPGDWTAADPPLASCWYYCSHSSLCRSA